MVYTSAHIDVTCEYGTATLWLRFPGRPVNALDIDRLRELDSAIAAIEANPTIHILVVRSGIPGGFCEGLHPDAIASLATDADAASFAWFVQRVFSRLANLEIPTVAFIDGACLELGVGLALACDYRLGLANVSTPIAFGPLFSTFAAHARGAKSKQISARAGQLTGFIDQAFCERRAKIELRSFLDVLERRPVKPRRRLWRDDGSAMQRRAFVEYIQSRRRFRSPASRASDTTPSPAIVGVLSPHRELRHAAANLAVQGATVLVPELDEHSAAAIAELQDLGFLTPLEASQARSRIVETASLEAYCQAGLVFASNAVQAAAVECWMNPASIIAVESLKAGELDMFRHPQRIVDVRIESRQSLTVTVDATAAERIQRILAALGFAVRIHTRPSFFGEHSATSSSRPRRAA